MKPILTTLALLHFYIACSQKSVNQYTKTMSFGGGNFNKQENKILINDNSSGIFNIYEIDLATKEKKQLTRSEKEPYYVIDYVPGANDFLYSADKGGNENSHIYNQKADGFVTDLTPSANEKTSQKNFETIFRIKYWKKLQEKMAIWLILRPKIK